MMVLRRLGLLLLVCGCLMTIVACNKDEDDEWLDGEYIDGGEYIDPNGDGLGVAEPPDGAAGNSGSSNEWRRQVLQAPLIAEAYNEDDYYEMRVYEGVQYVHNTTTGELISVGTVGDIRATVLKDWIVPHDAQDLSRSDALTYNETMQSGIWESTGTRIRALIGYYDNTTISGSDDKLFELVTRARTAEYLEYVYRNTVDDTYFRIVSTDAYILYSPLRFLYIFDIEAY